MGRREPALRAARAARPARASKNACEQGECGSCSVYLDGEVVCACLVLAAQAEGREVVTVEGLAPADELHELQRAFVECGAVQCGFCTPGLIVASHDLLRRDPDPGEADIREALAGNLCRCTGYAKIIDAVAARRGAAAMSVVTPPLAPDVRRSGRIGDSPLRADGVPKVRGEFAYASDLGAEGMLWGATLRSPHPRARISALDTAAAAAMPGVHAVLTHADVPGRKTYGLEHADQPVLAHPRRPLQGRAGRDRRRRPPRDRAPRRGRDRRRVRGARAGDRSRGRDGAGRAARCTRAATCCARW